MQKLLLAMMLFLLVGFACKEGFSQSISVDDSTTIEALVGQLQQLRESDLNGALALSQTIGQRAGHIHYQRGVWESGIEQAIILNSLGHADSSLSVINRVLQESQAQHDRLSSIKAHLGLAHIYQQNFNFQSGVDHLIQAEKLLQTGDAFDLRFDILNRQGNIHRLMKDYTSALKYYQEIEDQYLGQLSSKQKFFLFMNLGNVFVEQKDYGKTEALFKKAYGQLQQVNTPANQAMITYNLGALYFRQKRYEEARQFIDKALQANTKIGDRARIENCYRVLGAICFDQKDYLKARTYYHTALDIALSIKNPNAIMGNYNNLYQAYWNLGYYNKSIPDMDKALSYYQKYGKIKDSLYQIQTTAKVLELEKQYETAKKNSQITLLEKENQLQQDQILIEHTQHQYMILVIALVSVLLIVCVYFVYYYKRINKVLQGQSKSILEQKNQITEQNEQLQKLLNTQNRLFSIIAHDLRSPLISIFNISSLIEYYIEDKEYQALEETAGKMNRKITKILGLTDNLLSWAHSQRKNVELQLEPVSIDEIIAECLEIYRPIAMDKNITIEYMEQSDRMVRADRNRLRTICRNLINNAIKFTPINGSIRVWHEPHERMVRLCIKDTGIGIEQEKLAGLFEINAEKISMDTSGDKSSGLGLTICKEFVESMEGRIGVKSLVGVGTQFTVELKMEETKTPSARPAQKEMVNC